MVNYTYDDLAAILPYTGDLFSNLKMVLAHLDPDGSVDFTNWKLVAVRDLSQTNETYPCDKCICSHHIEDKFTAKHRTTGDTIIIGSTCVGRFSGKLKIEVGRERRRRKDTTGAKYCSAPDCNKKINQSVVNQYPTKENHYHKSCLAEVFGKCWGCGRFKNYDCDCEKRMIEIEKERIEKERIEKERIEKEKRLVINHKPLNAPTVKIPIPIPVRKCMEENCTNELKDPKNPDVRCVSCLYKPKYREKAQRQKNKLQ